MHEEQPTFGAPHTQACHNGNPIYAQTDARADTFKFVTPLSTPDGDQFGNPGDPYVISIEQIGVWRFTRSGGIGAEASVSLRLGGSRERKPSTAWGSSSRSWRRRWVPVSTNASATPSVVPLA